MAKKSKEKKPKKPKKEKKVKEIDPLKAARAHGMRFAGAQTAKPAMTVYTGLLLGVVLVLGAATAYAYVQGRKIAPGGDPLAPLKTYEDGGAFNPGR